MICRIGFVTRHHNPLTHHLVLNIARQWSRSPRGRIPFIREQVLVHQLFRCNKVIPLQCVSVIAWSNESYAANYDKHLFHLVEFFTKHDDRLAIPPQGVSYAPYIDSVEGGIDALKYYLSVVEREDDEYRLRVKRYVENLDKSAKVAS